MTGGGDIRVSNGAVLDMAPIPYIRAARPRATVLPPKPKRIWLVSFTDLMSLMVAFFVMMYAMSDPQLQDYKKLIDAIETRFKVDKETPTDTPAGLQGSMGDVDTITLPRTRTRSTIDGTYLQQVLEQRRAERPALAPAIINLVDRDVIIDVPFAQLYSGGDYKLTKNSREMVREFAQAFNGLPNRIEIAVDLAGPASTDVLIALMRGQNLLAELRAGGYRADTSILVNQTEGRSGIHFRVTHFEGQGRN